MGFIYRRGNKLWIRYKGPDGKLKSDSTGLDIKQRKKAERILAKIEARIAAGAQLDELELGPVTLKRYATSWIEEREKQGIISVKDDESILRNHILPSLGSMRLEEVKPKHIRALVRQLKQKKLAPRTVRNIYGVLHTLFRDAVIDELIDSNPCILKRSEHPKAVDKDPTWRSGAVFTRKEIEQLLSDPSVPQDRKVMYALLSLTGMRFGEVSALRWKHYEPEIKPLGKLLVATSYSTKLKIEKEVKTGVPREVPIHSTLARIIAEWRRKGWPNMMGRTPTNQDLIIPSREGKNRSGHHSLKKLHQDLERLGLRKRRQHDLRRSFISIARQDGAREDVLMWITHGRPGGIMNVYTEMPWALLCEQIERIHLALEGEESSSKSNNGAEAPTQNATQEGKELQSELQSETQKHNPSTYKGKKVWRRRESNPRPKVIQTAPLHV